MGIDPEILATSSETDPDYAIVLDGIEGVTVESESPPRSVARSTEQSPFDITICPDESPLPRVIDHCAIANLS